MNTVNSIGIDCETRLQARMINALKRLKSTISVQNGGKYHMSPECCVIRLETTMSEDQVDKWACRVKAGYGYIGTFKLL